MMLVLLDVVANTPSLHFLAFLLPFSFIVGPFVFGFEVLNFTYHECVMNV
jgi:hypothetical protein